MEHNIHPEAVINEERKVFSMQAQNLCAWRKWPRSWAPPSPHAYKVIHKLNAELREKGYLTISGRVNRNFFHGEVLLRQTGKEG